MTEQLPPIEVSAADGSTILVPRDRVYICNINPGKVSTHLTRSLVDLVDYDRANGFGLWAGNQWAESGANISKHRNEHVTRFLAGDGDWLLMVDSDMVVPPETILRLLAAAQVTGTKMIGALCVMVGDLGPIPTLYQHRDDAITGVQYDYPDDAQLQVAATGCGCLMVHRDVFEACRVKQLADREWLHAHLADPPPVLAELAARDMLREPSAEFGWFVERVRIKRHENVDGVSVSEHWMGEDIDFCLRMGSMGFPIFVDCTFEVGHAKHGRIWYPRDIRDGIGAPRSKIVAVVPVKDRLDLTADLVHQLRSQGDCDEIVICDNGSGGETRSWLATQDDLTVLEMPDAGVNEMWNAGAEHALDRHGPRARVAFLNNDLKLGPAFLRTLSQALTDHREMAAVCGNYDGRTADVAVVATADICAGRYDGTGGFAGFAFMVRGEWFGTGYRFPTECKWWFGDNDLIASIGWADTHRGYDDRPSRAGIVVAARVEHLDGGSLTAGDVGWSKFRDQIEKDRVVFEAKWSKIYQSEANAERIRGGDFEPLYEHLLTQPSDIVEHLPTLHDLAVKLDAQAVVELGVRSGVSTVAWLTALQRTGGHLWAVDVNPPPPMVTAHPKCTFLQGDDLDPETLDLVPSWADIVFIDTSHEYDQTVAEIKAYAEKIRPGGCMVFHDTEIESFDHHEPGTEPPFPVWKAIEDSGILRFSERRTVENVVVYENCNGLAVVWLPEVS